MDSGAVGASEAMAWASMCPSGMAIGRMRPYLRAWMARRKWWLYVAKVAMRENGGGARVQTRQSVSVAGARSGTESEEPQRAQGTAHDGVDRMPTQHSSQIGTEDKPMSGWQQRPQVAGARTEARGVSKNREMKVHQRRGGSENASETKAATGAAKETAS
jgi:hypothetical protein